MPAATATKRSSAAKVGEAAVSGGCVSEGAGMGVGVQAAVEERGLSGAYFKTVGSRSGDGVGHGSRPQQC